MPRRDARAIGFVERHPRYWPEAAAAIGELKRVLGDDVETFLLVDAEGNWEAACAIVDGSFQAARWVQARRLPAGDYASSQVEGLPAERLLRREDA